MRKILLLVACIFATYTAALAQTTGENCEGSLTVTIQGATSGSPLSIDSYDATRADCTTGLGSITIAVSGGSSSSGTAGEAGEYTFSWLNSSNTEVSTDQNPTGLAPGTYTVIVEDGQDCSATELNIEVLPPFGEPTLDNTVVTDASCNSESDGSIALDITLPSGASNVVYSWSGPGSFTASTEDLSGLAAGDYVLTISGDDMCPKTFDPITVEEPGLVLAAASVTNIADCFSGAGGSIELELTGNTTGVVIAWTKQGDATFTSDQATITGLTAGFYDVTVTYAGGCVLTDTYEITSTGSIVATLDKIDATCTADGTLTAGVDSPPAGATFTYQWFLDDVAISGATSSTYDFDRTADGVYKVIITSAGGCTDVEEITLEPLEDIVLAHDVATDVAPQCHDSENGGFTVTATQAGASSGATYSYVATHTDGTVLTSATGAFTGAKAGTWTVVVTSNQACTASIDVTLTAPDALTAGTCTNAQDYCDTGAGEIKVQSSGGTGPYTVTYLDSNGSTSSLTVGSSNGDNSEVTFTGAAAGVTYTFKVTDANGCMIGG